MYHFNYRIDKYRHTYACFFKHTDYIRQVIFILYRVPSVIGSKLTLRIGNQCNLVGMHFQNEVNKLLFCTIAFNVKLSSYNRFYFAYIIVTYMPFVRPWMNGDTIRAKALYVDS